MFNLLLRLKEYLLFIIIEIYFLSFNLFLLDIRIQINIIYEIYSKYQFSISQRPNKGIKIKNI